MKREEVEFQNMFWNELVKSQEIIYIEKLGFGSPLRSHARILGVKLLRRYFFTLFQKRFPKLELYKSNIDKLDLLYSWLSDDYSKNILPRVLARKILGYRFLPPLIDLEAEDEKFKTAENIALEKDVSNFSGNTNFPIHLFDLKVINYNITAYMNPMNVVWTFLSEQYQYNHSHIVIGPTHGDICIDAGGCWGDTALYFAEKGADQVFSFEFMEDNLAVFQKNLEENPKLSKKITIEKKAVWKSDNTVLFAVNKGPGSNIANVSTSQHQPEQHQPEVHSITIDSYVKEKGLNHIDFIKMDIEGSEKNALLGAKETIKKFGPKLAITVYHKPEDLLEIPHLIMEIRPDYQLYLDHFTKSNAETVLFAVISSDNI